MGQNPSTRAQGNNRIYTPEWAVDDMITFFKVSGKVLDPCRGLGAFSDKIHNCLWCEIDEGLDFYDWKESVDCTIGNPPYSEIRKFTLHAMSFSDRIIFLIPVWKAFNALGLMQASKLYGDVKRIRVYGGGGKLGFPMGNAVGAVEWCKGWRSGTSYSFYGDLLPPVKILRPRNAME